MYADLCVSVQKRSVPCRCEIKPRPPPQNAQRFMAPLSPDKNGQRLRQCALHFANDQIVTLISEARAVRFPARRIAANIAKLPELSGRK
jgi:hypothetical protein